jgi:hypothetical protein
MAVALMYDLPEMTHSRYGGAMRAINFDRRQPSELEFHAAWEKDEGGWQIFEVWESPEAWEAFFQDRYSQALRGRGREFSVTVLSNNVHQIYTNN